MSYSLSFSKSILVLVFISDKIRRGETDYISAKIISDLLDIPRPTLVVIFNSFIRAGILESKEGINGGVRFCRNFENISLYDILMAIENHKTLFQTNFDIKTTGDRPLTVKNTIVSKLTQIEENMHSELKTVTLKDIL